MGTSTGRVHAPKSLLEGLEGSRDGCGSEVHVLGVGLDLRHEPKLVNIEMSQALAEGKGRFPSSVCQFAVLAIVAGYSSVTSPSLAIPSATYHIPSISPVAPTATTASSLSPNASVFFRHSKPFHCERSWLLAAIWIIRRATLQYGQSSRVK